MTLNSRLICAVFFLYGTVFGTPCQSAAPSPSALPPDPSQLPQAPVPSIQSVAELSFFISTNVNPDTTGRPSPIIVRIYELRSVTVFNRTDFFSLFDREKEVLGGELLVRDELPLMPGSKPQAIKNLRSETRYLGIVAAFRDI